MSFLKLDSDREKREKLAEIERGEQEESEQEKKSDNIAYFALFIIVGLFVGYFLSDSRQTGTQIPTMIGTTTGLFLLSGLVALLLNWLTGKWKLAFAITFCLLAVASITSFVYEENRKSSADKPAFYQNR